MSAPSLPTPGAVWRAQFNLRVGITRLDLAQHYVNEVTAWQTQPELPRVTARIGYLHHWVRRAVALTAPA